MSYPDTVDNGDRLSSVAIAVESALQVVIPASSEPESAADHVSTTASFAESAGAYPRCEPRRVYIETRLLLDS